MANLSWNEIKARAAVFAREWADVTSEDREAKSFWDELFKDVFGVKRRAVASFEEPVKRLNKKYGYIDLFWKGTMLAEHKSAGGSLDKAHSQAMEYIQDLKNDGRDDEIPRYVVVCDFQNFAVHDLDEDTEERFTLAELPNHVQKLAFIPGYKQHRLEPEPEINVKAVERLGELHDALKDGGYTGHDLERFLVRILFCLFAEKTGLFEQPGAFTLYVENHTREDGSDLGARLAQLFQVLNTPKERRQANLLEELTELPYVNGELFAENLGFADFNREMRARLLSCCRFDWSAISPAVFGSLFQSVMEPVERRRAGAHYTSERDILKLVRSLFLDELRAEFERVKGYAPSRRPSGLKAFHDKIAGLTFFDPACGCGNFLVVTYRELRLLELEVLRETRTTTAGIQMVTTLEDLSRIDVGAMYGIEISEFPARIAEVAMWLVDHQMNQRLSAEFGQYLVRLPLRSSPHITNANSLRTDWQTVLPPARCSYVLGNPPFVGHQWRTADQQEDMALVWGTDGRFGRLDYVTAWYRKAAEYISGTPIRCAFVSTNSICQGEQVGTLWGDLLRRGVKIHFAHRTFSWQSEARGAAHVHVVIVGFGGWNQERRRVYDYEGDQSGNQAVVTECANINPYLVAGNDIILPSRAEPRPGIPYMTKGSQPTDGGNFVLTRSERDALIATEPAAEQWVRRYLGGEELINGGDRYCLWLKEADPSELRNCPHVLSRVAAVRVARLKSPTKQVRDYAEMPTLFTQDRQPDAPYIAVPEVSSIRRRFIPMAFLPSSVIASNQLQMIVGGALFHFGVLNSTMYMAWVRTVAGRLKSDYRHSPAVYGNFPWPLDVSDKQRAEVEARAQGILDARAQFPNATLADLYDPDTMPPALVTAHAALDRVVDRCYGSKTFVGDRERVEFLFELFERLNTPLTATPARPRRGRRGQSDAVDEG